MVLTVNSDYLCNSTDLFFSVMGLLCVSCEVRNCVFKCYLDELQVSKASIHCSPHIMDVWDMEFYPCNKCRI
jgi:hypothetical protein